MDKLSRPLRKLDCQQHSPSSGHEGWVAPSSPYERDMDGNVRGADGTRDRGTFECVVAGRNPPQNLRIDGVR